MEDITSEQLEKIESLLFAGRKIEAIKLVREITGMGLADAKTFVDKHAKELGEAYPEKMPASKVGCGGASLIFIILSLGSAGVYLAL